jgi:chorismate dehydratase
MKPIKISAVSYLNTFPFVHGITQSGFLDGFELSLDIPSLCAKKLLNGEVDLALVPVAAILNKPEFSIYTDYCIGCNGSVKTVLLLSQVPLNEIKSIHLDFHSVTSVNLVKVLAKELWNIQPQWKQVLPERPSAYKEAESIVAIGDKTFTLKSEFQFCYDLGEEWKKLTGLPFVFACWAGRAGLSKEFIEKLNIALSWGVAHLNDAININSDRLFISKNEALDYLQNDLSFQFDDIKRKAMHQFYDYLKKLNT